MILSHDHDAFMTGIHGMREMCHSIIFIGIMIGMPYTYMYAYAIYNVVVIQAHSASCVL